MLPLPRVVLLGRQGFVARALNAAFQDSGQPSIALGRADLDLSGPAVGEQLAKHLQPGDHVIVLAALTPEHGRDGATLRQNVAMAENVADAIGRSNLGHLTYVSSDAVYGWESSLISEATPPSPTDLYGMMHVTRELLIKERATRANVPCAIVRPSAIYGSGDTHRGYGPNRFFHSLREKGRIDLFGGGEEKRDHIFIGDIVALLRELSAINFDGVLNAVSGSSFSFRDVAEGVRQACGGCGDITIGDRRQPISHRFFDNTRLRRIVPRYVPTQLARGLELLCNPRPSR